MIDGIGTQFGSVIATKTITEQDFMGKKLHTHARKGDRGEIVYTDGEGSCLVRFARSGTATDVDLCDADYSGGNARLAERTSTPGERADAAARAARARRLCRRSS